MLGVVLEKSQLSSSVLNKDGVILLFINHAFFTVIMLGFILLLLSLINTSVAAANLIPSVTILITCFVLVNVNMLLANYLVQTIQAQLSNG